MVSPDPAVVAGYGRAFARLGVTVQATFKRVTGTAPNVTTQTATIDVVVRNYILDHAAAARTGVPATSVGAITQGDRQMIVQTSDLVAAGFPVPLQKNDKVILADMPGSQLNIAQVDPFKRAAAGAVEVRATGIP